MRKSESNVETVSRDERRSRREQFNVKIVEHEVVTRIRISNEGDATSCSLPRLVITDAITATREFVSKRRSEFRELDNFLKTVVGPSLSSR